MLMAHIYPNSVKYDIDLTYGSVTLNGFITYPVLANHL